MNFLSLDGEWSRAVAAGLALFIVLGLLAAGFALSAGGSPEEAREAVEEAVEEEAVGRNDRPATVWAGPLRLPTDNVALFKENGAPQFYQYVNRHFEGQSSQPWEAGQYGFVRTPVRTEEMGVVYTRFHEGIDIRATRRDGRGEPRDTVRATDDGTVAYINESAPASNYGKYVVVEHEWKGTPYYSLYAHLSEPYVETGERVRQGAPLGRMGYTGAGIDKQRAHMHFELNVLINDHFQQWIEKHFGGNPHGVYSGLNMRGFDPASYLEALRDDPDLTPAKFLTGLDPYYKVAFPRNGPLDVLRRYPWMRPSMGSSVGDSTVAASAPSWEMSFTRGGFPLKVEPYSRELSGPTVTMSAPPEVPDGVSCMHLTYEHLKGATPNCTLAPRGRRYIDLITIQGPGESGSRRVW
jgi:murein DD-endopeptidase MepM/ murein hydrolase activator NlpD